MSKLKVQMKSKVQITKLKGRGDFSLPARSRFGEGGSPKGEAKASPTQCISVRVDSDLISGYPDTHESCFGFMIS
jgi:hypothetical protein